MQFRVSDSLIWNGNDDEGSIKADGVFFCKLQTTLLLDN